MSQIALLSIAGAVAAYFIVRILFQRDTAVEQRRLDAIGLSDTCGRNGLPLLSKALKAYAVADYSGLAFAVRDIRDTVSDPDQFEDVVNRFLGIQLDKKLKTAEGREELVKAIEDRLGIEIPRDIIKELPKRKLVTEDQAADEADAAVDAALASIPPQQV